MSAFILVLEKTLGQLVWDAILWPFWWYSVGLDFFWRLAGRQLKSAFGGLALGVWAANLFVPMFGQYDRAGRIISFFIRLFQVIARSIWLFFYGLFWLALFIVWLLLPFTAVYALFAGRLPAFMDITL